MKIKLSIIWEIIRQLNIAEASENIHGYESNPNKVTKQQGRGAPTRQFLSPNKASSTRIVLCLITLLAKEAYGNTKQFRLLVRLLVVLYKLKVSSLAEDDTCTTHWTWKSWTCAYREPPPSMPVFMILEGTLYATKGERKSITQPQPIWSTMVICLQYTLV